MFQGSFVALITPFINDQIDETALRKLVNWQINQGSHGLVPVGTTGESPTLSEAEHKQVIEIVVDETAGRLPIIAGCGSNNTKTALELTAHAEACGVDATLHVTGYYNRPSQEGIYQHFLTLDSDASKPIIVYNIPPRTNNLIQLETMLRLATLESVIGVKDATQDLARPARERLSIGAQFSLLSGEDATAVAYNAAGGNGCISVTANIAPALCAQIQQACIDNNYPRAMQIQQQLLPLHDALFLEPSPAGVKYAASLLGLCSDECRLPIIPITKTSKDQIQNVFRTLNLTA